MAEFTEVCRQAKRMLHEMSKAREGKPRYMVLYIHADGGVKASYGPDAEVGTAAAEDIEKSIMQWAAEHPETVYPTWREWQEAISPDADALITPCQYMSKEQAGCYGQDCSDCRDNHIPADIAAKLGVKPIENKEGTAK